MDLLNIVDYISLKLVKTSAKIINKKIQKKVFLCLTSHTWVCTMYPKSDPYVIFIFYLICLIIYIDKNRVLTKHCSLIIGTFAFIIRKTLLFFVVE